MSISFSVSLDSQDEARVLRALKDRRTKVGRVTAVAAEPTVKFLDMWADQLATTMAEEAPKFTGRLASSFKTKTQDGKVDVFSTVEYALFVATGTRPHWPPVNALRAWAAAKGIPAYLVARKIALEGTEPNDYIDRASERVWNTWVPRGLRDATVAIESDWRTP